MIPRTEHRRQGWLLEALQKILEGTGERTLQRSAQLVDVASQKGSGAALETPVLVQKLQLATSDYIWGLPICPSISSVL